MNLILTQRVFSLIEQECLRYPQVETGGILVGRCDCGDVLAILAIGSGPGARRSDGPLLSTSSFPLGQVLFDGRDRHAPVPAFVGTAQAGCLA